MRFIKTILTLSIFSILFYSNASAQDGTVLNKIMTKTAKIYQDMPIERVYLHFDKPYYALGDTIWFKAYLTLDQHQPSQISKIIYVDLLTAKDSLVESLKIPVKNSVAWADIPISQYTYKKGNYRIVAYTNWMNNFGPEYFFNKNITIGDAINNSVSTLVSLKRSVFPKYTKISAGISYKDDEGKPYSEKKVTWTIEKDYDEIAKGKGVTDKNGYIDIGFANVKNIGLDSTALITVIDRGDRKQGTSKFSLKSVSKPNDMQFFPEGGQLIGGIPTKVAFKALKPDGLGIDVKGTITDNTNKVVAEFSSAHLGMGYFLLTPEDGKTYTAHVSFADGTEATPDLPKILADATTINIDNTDPESLKIKLLSDAAFVKENAGKTFFILAKSSGVICFAAQTKLQNQVYTATVPKSKFPTGIVQVTLFSDDGEPLSERIAFIMHNDQLNLSVASDHPSYTTRQKVKLSIAAKNGDKTAEGNFSVAVIDDSKVPVDENSETTILSYLLLTADIGGYVEKPNYYFNHPDEKKLADLDILLQTQGYRRFSYDGIMTEKYPSISFLPEQGITLTGTLRAFNGMAIGNGNVSLKIKDKNYSANAVTDADGRFRFPNLVFSDSTQVFLSARNNTRASDLVLTADGDPYQKINSNPTTPDAVMNIDSTLSSYLKNSKVQFNNSHVLKEVVIKDTRIVKTVSHKDYSSLSSLSSEPDHLIKAEMLQGCGNVLNCIKVFATGMIYENNNFYVMRDYNSGNKTPVQVFVKGMPVDNNYLENISAAEIESVEIFLKDELGLVNSAYNSNGAIVVNMKKAPEGQKITLAQLRDLIPPKNELTISPKGYVIKRSFYLPRYSGPRASQPNQIDTRSTIYWNSNIVTDATGTASFEFFNSDGTGTYRAIVEGIDKDGNIGRQLFRYTVK
ncbi:carboxypeptidase-like regulatory domain-containing protein [Mucilaginibacter sp. BJC16-A38]|uniref:carboxypeptidase-like regulatory domain-containing protein n=1 Tax=Mucilaginibacter phenanthrenivorans TaxID=1234842 RepID=UPI00215750A7|nr:carboxypeptidase-like regulatory domain-containing protein [Mucilaginibacter phenanthrenivorans]MCR8560584.1 carboxypeptidase-like regulatory domain-containing protein [Mucilaginibacter phenanthrenivorans]